MSLSTAAHPIDAPELAGQIANSSRPRAQTVAGFDLTFRGEVGVELVGGRRTGGGGGDIAVWRAARGIDPQDPRPTGGHQLEAAVELWKQHLDRDVARAIEPHNSNLDQREGPRKDSVTVTTSSARIKSRRTLRLRPAASDRSH